MSSPPALERPSAPLSDRELSWLDFNARVLAQSTRASLPLLERLKFVAIAASNLDEFYMVRVASLMRKIAGKSPIHEGSESRPQEVLPAVVDGARAQARRASELLETTLLPALRERGVAVLDAAALGQLADTELDQAISAYYAREVHPCLTPIAIDLAHPFPKLRNRSLNLAFRIESTRARSGPGLSTIGGRLLAIVGLPPVLPRFVPIPTKRFRACFVPLETIIALHAEELFPGHRVVERGVFRLTRASDLELVEEESENLLVSIEGQLRRRDRLEGVRLELSSELSDELGEQLRELVDLDPLHVHRHPGLVAPGDLMQVYRASDAPDLKDDPWTPVAQPALRFARDLFARLREGDVLLHHPYESFGHVVDFVERAADDPDVVAIKMTLYRTSGDSPIVRALARAAERGKQVTAVVELKARFDEAANIAWARALEEHGAHVVYGLLGLKVHAKLLLVVRREGQELRRYLHVSTGNYNPTTASLYSDLSLLTARDDLTSDAMLLFNVLTGYGDLPELQRLIVSPFNLRQHVVELIAREIEHARAGRPARLVAKLNALVDAGIIRALYRASQAGVQVELLVRGACCLRPGVPGVSENIRVRGVVDRFLEHARVFHWLNGGAEEVYLSSADWMPRNLNRRIEVAVPVLDPALRERIKAEVLGVELADVASTWTLGPDGTYAPPPDVGVRAQTTFMRLARERAQPARTALRRELAARTPSTGADPVLPALRAVEAARRRRGAGSPDT